jgi:small subunit ribosomal protein S14
MTTSDYTKTMSQISHKTGTLKKFKKHNTIKKRSCGRNLHKCVRCGRTAAHIKSYSLHLCRQCFRNIASKIGFKKYN